MTRLFQFATIAAIFAVAAAEEACLTGQACANKNSISVLNGVTYCCDKEDNALDSSSVNGVVSCTCSEIGTGNGGGNGGGDQIGTCFVGIAQCARASVRSILNGQIYCCDETKTAISAQNNNGEVTCECTGGPGGPGEETEPPQGTETPQEPETTCLTGAAQCAGASSISTVNGKVFCCPAPNDSISASSINGQTTCTCNKEDPKEEGEVIGTCVSGVRNCFRAADISVFGGQVVCCQTGKVSTAGSTCSCVNARSAGSGTASAGVVAGAAVGGMFAAGLGGAGIMMYNRKKSGPPSTDAMAFANQRGGAKLSGSHPKYAEKNIL